MGIFMCICRLIWKFHGTFADHAILTSTPLDRGRLDRYLADLARTNRRLTRFGRRNIPRFGSMVRSRLERLKLILLRRSPLRAAQEPALQLLLAFSPGSRPLRSRLSVTPWRILRMA